MYQNSFLILKKSTYFSVLILSIFSLVVLNGCKSNILETDSAPVSSTETKPPVQPTTNTNGIVVSYADVVDRVAPAVVKVTVEQRTKVQKTDSPVSPFEDFFKGLPQNPQQPRTPQIERGLGSGVIVSADGTILTNHHVVEGAEKIQIEMNDKRTLTAKIVGSDELSDLAVLKVEAKDLPFLNFGDSDKVRVGDVVLAIGNPLGIGQTVTSGIISAKGRSTRSGDGSFEDFLQTDAPINRGNSGGALINVNGELIGINSQILSTSGGSIGIGFSIPTNMAKPIMEQLLKNGKVSRGQLGVVIQPITEELAKNLELKEARGILVSDVKKGSAAEKAGVKRGDIITAINGEKIDDSNNLRNKVAATAPGSEIKLAILRDGTPQELTVKLDELSSETAKTEKSGNDNNSPEKSAENGKLGLELQPLTPEIAKQLGISDDTKGLIVSNVDPSGPAAEQGIIRGDVILEINKQSVSNYEDVQNAISKAGDKPSLLLISRKGQTVYITIQPRS